MLKKYNLPYRRVPGGEERVAADTISMSRWGVVGCGKVWYGVVWCGMVI